MRFDPDSYVPVCERVEKFYERFPQGRILTAVVEHDRESGFVLMRAEAYRDPTDTLPAATGHAFEVRGGQGANQTSHVENAETSCVGRALALLGFEVKRGIASREEVQKVNRNIQAAHPSQDADEVCECECGLAARYWQSPDGAKAGYFCPKRKDDPSKCQFKKWVNAA